MEDWRPFLDGLEEGVIFLDEKRYVMAINRAASRMINQDYESVVGRLCPTLFEGVRCAQACTAQRGCSLVPSQAQMSRTLDLTLKQPERTPIVLRMWSVLLAGKEKSARYAIILKDRTRESLLEEETRERLRLGGMVGRSAVMRQLYQSIMQAALSPATVLIQGESGTGKELIARALHDNSPRNRGPYIRVHCAAFPENLLENELFGHVKGAFTGAATDRPGRFEAAHGGTIFLDEIGEISPQSQVKLLRVLQEKEVDRLGENQPRKVDIRIIAATNRDLAAMVSHGMFREDLYYRLNVLTIHVPPLRDRDGDIPLLARALLGEMALRYGRKEINLSEEALALLEGFVWPGNVRELANVLENALVRASGDRLLPEHFPATMAARITANVSANPGSQATKLEKVVRYYRQPPDLSEREMIINILRETGWNKVWAAKKLGMSRTTLWQRIRRYAIDQEG
ncbi:MAG: sigma-54-dependent Fis family transcriptional regulator [Magnetococcales bacterium]|nr:sigma-54-dependent Fis family transcriptional regulator [Magnetococcales bacterium]